MSEEKGVGDVVLTGRRGRNALHATLDGGKQLGDSAAAWLMHLLGGK